MQSFRFQPPGCSIWVVGSEGGPAEGRFRWELDPEGRPCRPELHVDLNVDRSEAFRLAIEHEERWKWVLADFEQRRARQQEEQRRADEAFARWEEIRGQWEETKRRVQARRAARQTPGPPAARPPACFEALGLAWPCTEEQIKRAFRAKAMALHPDRGGTQEAFVALRQAYEEALALSARR